MTWRSIRERVNQLPLVLCGPILRRVDRRSVSVWLVTKRECTVKLEVEALSDSTQPRLVQEARSIRFGNHIWITVVRAESPVDLPWRTLFAYDLTLTTPDGTSISLDDALQPTSRLGKLFYGNLNLPTFVTPPREARDLHIIHGSCRKPHGVGGDPLLYLSRKVERKLGRRKPHGTGGDALRLVDTCLSQRADDVAIRPCQMYLTGDQIYADDVADALLFMIRDAVTVLVGYEEQPPGASAVDLRPGNRAALTVRAGLTAGFNDFSYAKSHLMTFGEYLVMYLFVWSDTLWPAPDGWPAATDLGVDRGVFDEEVAALKAFRAGLPDVRRALANIATYMIFDDHDISDDWNIFRDWAWNVYSGRGLDPFSQLGKLAAGQLTDPFEPAPNLGRRIVLDGLAAYAVCQAWGNDAVKLEAGVGRDLLNNISAWSEGNPIALAVIERILLPPTTNPIVDGRLANPPTPFTWSFALSFPGCDWESVFLDGRCRRSWSGATHDEMRPTPAAITTGLQLLDQLGAIRGAPYLFLISPAPVFGVRIVEWFQEAFADNYLDKFSLSESYNKDYESWSANPPAMHFLLYSLAEGSMSPGQVAPRAVIILSGDVHHGFSFRVTYRRTTPQPRGLVFVQYTSSPYKNAEFKASVLRSAERLAASPMGLRIRTWESATGADGEISDSIPVKSPALVAMGDPRWRGRLTTLKDSRTDIFSDPIKAGIREIAEAIGATRFLATDRNRVVVDYNHFSEVYFGLDASKEVVSVIQGLYVDGADVGGKSGQLIQTQHVASLSPDLPVGSD